MPLFSIHHFIDIDSDNIGTCCFIVTVFHSEKVRIPLKMTESDSLLLSLELDSAFSGELSERQIENIVENSENEDSFLNSLEDYLFQNDPISPSLDGEAQEIIQRYCYVENSKLKKLKNIQSTPDFFVDLHGFSRHSAKEIVLRSLIMRPNNTESTFVFVQGKGKHAITGPFIMESNVSEALAAFGVQGNSDKGRYRVTLPPPDD